MKLNEILLKDWLLLSKIIKNDRMVEHIPYTEAFVLYLIYLNIPHKVSIKHLIEKSKMLKSQMNRTLNQLKKKELIAIEKQKKDLRCKEISLTTKGIQMIQLIHSQSLNASQKIIELIGEEDSKELIRIFEKVIQEQDKLL